MTEKNNNILLEALEYIFITNLYETIKIALIFVGLVLALKKLKAILQGVETQKDIARKNNSLNLIFQFNEDLDLKDGLKLIWESFQDDSRKICDFVKVKIDKEAKPEEAERQYKKRITILYTLNFFENIAIGIRKDIYDETVIRDSLNTLVKRSHHESQSFIDEYRKQFGQDTYCEHYQWLAEKWEADSKSIVTR